MTDKIGPLDESLKPTVKAEDSDPKRSDGNDLAKRRRKNPAGRLGNNKSTGSSQKERKASTKKTSVKKRTAVKKDPSKEPAAKILTQKAVVKKAAAKKPPASEPSSTGKAKQVVEPDHDKTSAVDVKETLGEFRPTLLDRLLDTSSPLEKKKFSNKKPDAPKNSTDQVEKGTPLQAKKSDDLFSNLNRSSKSEKSGSSDDFKDPLSGGLRGSEAAKVVQPKSKAEYRSKQDHKRRTRASSNKAASAKKPVNRVSAASSDKVTKKVTVVDADATDEIRGDGKNPIGRQTSRPKPTPGPVSRPKTLVDGSKDSSKSTTIHETPTNEVEEETTKPEADLASEKSSSDMPSISAGVTAVRKRASEKAEAAKKRLAETSAVNENTQSTAEMLKEDTTSTVQDKDAQTKISNDSGISSRKTEEVIEKQEPEDGFESSNLPEDPEPDMAADVADEMDRGGRSFKVSTESVKQSLRPPPRVRARKVRRVIRHVDPWSVLTFSVLFHLTIFSSLLLGSVLVWQVAAASGTIENIEDVVKDLGSFQTYELNGWAILRAAVAVAAIFTLASTILVVIMSVIFNLISDLVGGIRVTVVQEETVRVQRDK